jgi:hypothetical protein
MKSRIYEVKIALPTPTVRLVRAANVAAAFRHVAESLIEAEVATQDALVALLSAGVKVEDAAAAETNVVAIEAPTVAIRTSGW